MILLLNVIRAVTKTKHFSSLYKVGATVNTAQETDEREELLDGACALVLDEIQVSDQSEKTAKCVGCVEKDNQLKDWENKFAALQKTYLTQCHHFSELTIKHKVLLSSLDSSPFSSNDNATSEVTDDIFSETELKILENMPLDKKKDSTFVLHCLEYAYKNNLDSFSGKTLKGVPESVKFDKDGREIRVPKKDPFTPEKVARIRQLFVKRLSNSKIDSASFSSRVSEANFNKIFASCVKNIANKND